MTVRSIRMPISAGDHEGERHRERRATSRTAPGCSCRITSWTTKVDVGAEHHHLAVRHVDDAHHAEGDGEADRGEQQHRAERKRRTRRSAAGPTARGCLDRGDRAAARLARPPAACPPAAPDSSASASWSPRPRITATASSLSASLASRRIEDDGGARLAQRPLDRGNRFPWRGRLRAPAGRSASRDLNTAWAAS